MPHHFHTPLLLHVRSRPPLFTILLLTQWAACPFRTQERRGGEHRGKCWPGYGKTQDPARALHSGHRQEVSHAVVLLQVGTRDWPFFPPAAENTPWFIQPLCILCILLATYMQPTCSLHATFMQPTCNLPAAYMRPTCSLHATNMQPTCSRNIHFVSFPIRIRFLPLVASPSPQHTRVHDV